MENGKANLAPPPEGKDWYRIVGVSLGNGGEIAPESDNVGVVVSWKWPDPLDGVTGSDFDAAAQAIRTGAWRENAEANNWVGIPIARAMGLSLANNADKAKVKGLVKIWIGAGHLVVVERLDEKRMPRKFVEVREDD